MPSAPPVTSAPGAVASPLPQCRSLQTVDGDRITFTTADPAPAPWFVGNDPANGEGYEASVAVAAAQVLGYTPAKITWVRRNPADVKAGRAAGFDVAVAELPTPDQTSPLVDYSTGYFPVTDSVVTRPGATRTASLASLKALRVGTVNQVSGSGAGTRIDRAAPLKGYATSAAALTALQAGSVDALVLDTPTALTAGSAVKIVGQLPTASTSQPVQLGMVLPKNSKLTSCVSAALDLLRINGTLVALQKKWAPESIAAVLH